MDDTDIGRIKQKLWEALYSLVGASPTKVRIHDVMLNIIALMEHQIPDLIVKDFAFVKHQLTKGPIDLSDREATEIGHKVLEMYTKLKGGIS